MRNYFMTEADDNLKTDEELEESVDTSEDTEDVDTEDTDSEDLESEDEDEDDD